MKKYLTALAAIVVLTACNNRNPGNSTPIDSTIVNGTAPATYHASNPADDTSSKINADDTGTKASNVHNSGTR